MKFIKATISFTIAIVGLFSIAFLVSPQIIFAQGDVSEYIADYHTDITIQPDSSLKITETLVYEFGQAQKHGIFREIPYKYQARGGNFALRLSDFTVTDINDKPINFSESKSAGMVKLKIGDADKYVSGEQVYKISYLVKRAINYFPDHDELYWNVVGTGWQVPIQSSSATINVPTGSLQKWQCYTGVQNSTAQDCKIEKSSDSQLLLQSSQELGNGAGMTVVVGMNKGMIQKPTIVQQILDIVIDNRVLFFPVIIFIGLFLVWYRYGKDAKSKLPIVAQYDAPEQLSPMYIGGLLENAVSSKSLAGEVIYLASQGYLTIKRLVGKKLLFFKSDDYELTQTIKPIEGLQSQTQKLLESIFQGGRKQVLLSELKKDRGFGSDIAQIKSKTMKELTSKGYFKANLATVRGLPLLAVIIFWFIGFTVIGEPSGLITVLAIACSIIITIVFIKIMPAKTIAGSDIAQKIAGLKDYLQVAESDRIAFHDAPEKTTSHFSALLPFAIGLGVEKAWSKKFANLDKVPEWYTDSTNAHFNSLAFANSLGSFSTTMAHTATSVSTASSGGSGFSGGGSGGGGGGGGGGSW